MNIGVTSLTFRNYTVNQVIGFAKNADIHGIEWGESENHVPLGNVNRAKEIANITQYAGLKIFSFGSYYKLGQSADFKETLLTAIALQAPIVRVWAGTLGSVESSDENFNAIIYEAKTITNMAQQNGIKIAFEYHENTLTDSKNSAEKLITAINNENCGLYWQPNQSISFEENYDAIKKLIPYYAGNFHIHSYSAKEGYQLLENIKHEIFAYFGQFVNDDFNLLIEFVKKHDVENFYKDVKTVREVLKC